MTVLNSLARVARLSAQGSLEGRSPSRIVFLFNGASDAVAPQGSLEGLCPSNLIFFHAGYGSFASPNPYYLYNELSSDH
jgi:hypothetical protein